MLRCFDASDEMLVIGVPALRWVSTSFLFAGICIPCSTIFQAVGKGMYSMWMSLIRQLIVLLPVAYLFAVTLGLPAVWFSFPIAEISSILMALFFLKKTYDKQLKDLPE